MGGKRKLELIAVYLTKEKKEALEEWATAPDKSELKRAITVQMQLKGYRTHWRYKKLAS